MSWARNRKIETEIDVLFARVRASGTGLHLEVRLSQGPRWAALRNDVVFVDSARCDDVLLRADWRGRGPVVVLARARRVVKIVGFRVFASSH